jgi:transcriptional regulator with XRE-family HTH domain
MAKKIVQEEFDVTSSRTYVSALERGIKQPTLAKVDGLAAVLQVHPLTLLTLAYTDVNDQKELERLVNTILLEAQEISAGLATGHNPPP